MRVSSKLDMAVRPYEAKDQEEVLSLLRASLGSGPAGDRSAGFFRWKHLENPFGRSYLLVGESSGTIVGLRAFLRWRLRSGDNRISAVRAVDTATHPEYRGQGIFSRLTRRAIVDLRQEADLVFNTPNAKSLPGYLRMGWQPVGTVRPSVRVCRLGAILRAVRSSDTIGSRPRVEAPPASSVFNQVDEVDRLLEQDGFDQRLRTDRSGAYLKWRYGRAPLLDYRAVITTSTSGLDGVAVFRVRPRSGLWEATVAELLFPRGDVDRGRRLLKAVVRSADVDVITARFPAGSTAAQALRRSGFVPAPRGVTLVVNPLRTLDIDPERPASWALNLGDLEVF
jgi:GNAT superfamily N-acetyltransferase